MKRPPMRRIPIELIRVDHARAREFSTNRDIGTHASLLSMLHEDFPVVVSGDEYSSVHRLVVGYLNYLAYQRAGRARVPAVLVGELTERRIAELARVEGLDSMSLDATEMSRRVTDLYRLVGEDEMLLLRATYLCDKIIRDYVQFDTQASDHAKEVVARGIVRMGDALDSLDEAGGDADRADALMYRSLLQ